MSEIHRIQSQLGLSIVAGIMVMVIATAGHETDAYVVDTDRVVLAMVLTGVCGLGISMALRPNWWRRRLCQEYALTGDGHIDRGAGGGTDIPKGPRRRGHHPDCGRFARHTVSWRGRRRCSGCTGLAIGAATVILLVWVYALVPGTMEWLNGLATAFVGTLLVALTLFSAWAGGVDPRANLGLNGLMVMGFGLVSVGLLESTGELAWGLVGVVISILWMDTRIQASRWNHAAICVACEEECVAYSL